MEKDKTNNLRKSKTKIEEKESKNDKENAEER